MPRGSYLLGAEEPNDAHYDILCFNPNVCDLAAAIGDITVYYVPAEMEALGMYIMLLTQVHADNVAPIVTLDFADYDYTTNRAEIGTWTFGDHDAAGTETYIPFTAPQIVQAGQTLILEHQVQADDAGAQAGTCHVQAYVRWTGRG